MAGLALRSSDAVRRAARIWCRDTVHVYAFGRYFTRITFAVCTAALTGHPAAACVHMAREGNGRKRSPLI